MCVIIISPRGASIPSKSELFAAYMTNPHGCGFVSESRYYRSLEFEDFYREIRKVKREENCIIHFRYATHGSQRVDNCHPFEKNGVYFAHNGVLPIRPIEDKTDSETAFIRKLYPAIEKYGFYSPKVDKAVEEIIGWSKFAFMKDGEIRYFGDFKKSNGRLYSNFNHFRYYTPCPRPTYKTMTWDEYLRYRR